MDQTPETVLSKAKNEKGDWRPRPRGQQNIHRRNWRKRVTRLQIASARILKGADRHDTTPKRISLTRSNESLVYFIKPDGDRDWEVISRLYANDKNFEPRWKKIKGQLIFQVRKGDNIEITAGPNNKRRIYRVVTFSPSETSVDLRLLPVEEARSTTEVPKSIIKRIRSIKGFNSLNPRHVTVEASGRIKWQSRLGN